VERGCRIVNAGLKLPENQRFEIVGFLALSGRILWFDPRREYSSIPTANSRSRRAQGLSRLAASSRPPAGLGLDWPEHGGILDRIGAGGAHHIVGKFKPLVLGEIHAAGDTYRTVKVATLLALIRRVEIPGIKRMSPGARRYPNQGPCSLVGAFLLGLAEFLVNRFGCVGRIRRLDQGLAWRPCGTSIAARRSRRAVANSFS
jgi:hypothetical protein